VEAIHPEPFDLRKDGNECVEARTFKCGRWTEHPDVTMIIGLIHSGCFSHFGETLVVRTAVTRRPRWGSKFLRTVLTNIEFTDR